MGEKASLYLQMGEKVVFQSVKIKPSVTFDQASQVLLTST